MPNAILVLITSQLAGELVADLSGLPVPGIVFGLLLLLGLLTTRGLLLGPELAIPPGLDAAAKVLHGNFGLLFVPAGAGILTQTELLAEDGLAILTAVVLSTAVGIAVTARLATGRRLRSAAREPPMVPFPRSQP